MLQYKHVSEQDVSDAKKLKRLVDDADYVFVKLLEVWEEKKLYEQAIQEQEENKSA